MADRSVTVVLRANITDFKTRMREAEQAVDRYGRNADGTAKKADTALGRMALSAQNNRQAWDQAGTALLGFGAVTAGALGASVKAAIDWESQFAGVKKTTDVSGLSASQAAKAYAGLEDGLRDMARNLPATQEEIAGVAEAAGQLGVKREDVLGFTRVMIDLGETTNLTAEEAATSLARFSNIMGTSSDDVSRLGSTLVGLGNNAETTESEILEMATRLAAAGRQAGLSEAEVFAFASTLSSVGVEAEAGGTAMSKVFTSIADSVRDGSDKLDVFAEVAGVSSAEFQQAFGQDAGGAIEMFVAGLGRIAESGGSTTAIFEELELTDQRLMRALLSTGQAQGLLNEQLEMGAGFWDENSALLLEASQRYDTTAAKIDIAKNNVRDAAISFGEVLLPAVAAASEGVAGFAQGIAGLPEPVKAVGSGLAAAAGGASLIGGAFLLTFPRVMDTVSAFRDLRDISPGVASGLGKVGKAAGIAAAVYGVATAAEALTHAMGPAAQSVEDVTAKLIDVTDAAWGMDTLFDDNAGSVDTFVDALGRVQDKNIGEKLFDPLIGALGLTGRRMKQVEDDFASVDQALVNMVQSGQQERAAELFADMAAKAEDAGFSVEQIEEVLPGYTDALVGLENQQKLAGGAAGGMNNQLEQVPGAAGVAAEGAGMLDAALGDTQDQLTATQERLNEWRDDMASTVESFVEPLDVYDKMLADKEEAERESAEVTAESTKDASDSWEDHVDDVEVELDEYAKALRKQNERQEQWRKDLVKIQRRGGTEVVQILAEMGVEGAALTNKFANASEEDFNRLRREMIRDARFGQEGVVDQISIMETRARLGAKGTAEGIAKELGIGADEVQRIASRYSINLAEGINPILSAVGENKISTRQWQVRADGGIDTPHVAQIAQGQTPFRVWAEPETGGEAYIPLAESKRSRSLAIWRETGKRLGVENPALTEMFADGGFTSASDVPEPPGTGKYRAPLSTAGGGTMDHAYDETRDWVDANAAMSGVAGIGSAGGSGGRGWQWQMAVLRRVFPGLPLNSGYRPGAITALGNRSMHGMGRAVDVPPRPEVFNWIKANYGASTRQLFFSPMGAILNGRPWNMDSTTRRGHYDHIHWGYRDGGFYEPGSPLNPHVRDGGGPLLPGFTYNGTGRNETVVSGAAGGAAPTIAADVRVFVGDRELTDIVRVEVDHVSNAARDRLQYAGTH